MTKGFRVVAPHFVAGGSILDGRCIEAAPIIHYMVGWTEQRIEEYCQRKGWECEFSHS